MEDGLMISVIMPVYKVEKYLDKAIESVLNQTYRNLELILVDDCSPDGSGKLCDEWMARDSRVRVIHLPQNEGASNARNTGITSAVGQYIHFMDADDILDVDTYEKVIESLNTHSAKVIIFGAIEEYYNDQNDIIYTKKVSLNNRYFSDKASLRKEIIRLEESTLYGYLWNKVYSLEYLRSINLMIPEMTLNEDIIFNILFFMDIDSMTTLNIIPYHYIKRKEGSVTSQFASEYYKWHRIRIEKLLKQHEYWNLATDEVKRVLSNIYTRYIFSALQRNCDKRSGMTYKDQKDWLISLYNDDLYSTLSPYSNPDSRILSILDGLLKSKRSILVITMAKLILVVKNSLPGMFIRLKQMR
jgi:glycosyltransferase involved in cell wall biosynthesis